MAKVKLQVADNVSLKRDGHIHRSGNIFETEKDDEIERWIELGYVKAVRRRR